jgi:ubiquinone/menaquinone biosynthesis C-methylase UbiE
MQKLRYLMENQEEILRLEIKTDPGVIEKQARWAGIAPGMRVADIGCGTGKTTLHLHRLVQPGGEAVGYDGSEERIGFARKNYARDGLSFVQADVCRPFTAEYFDFIWVRFFLEYHRSRSFEIVKKPDSAPQTGRNDLPDRPRS